MDGLAEMKKERLAAGKAGVLERSPRQREKGLWNFLTWSFFMAQVVAAHQMLTSSAMAGEAPQDAAHGEAAVDPQAVAAAIAALNGIESAIEQVTGSAIAQSTPVGGVNVAAGGDGARHAMDTEVSGEIAEEAGRSLRADSYGALKDVTGSASDIDTPTVIVVDPGGGVGPILDPVIEIVDDVRDGVLPPVIGVGGEVLDPVVEIVDTVVDEVVAPVVGGLVDVIDPVIDGVVTPVIGAVEDVVETLVPVVDGVVAPVVDLAGGLVDALEPVVDGVVAPVAGVVDGLVDVVDPVIDGVVSPVIGAAEDVVETLVPVVDGVVAPVVDLAGGLVDVLEPVVDGVVAPVAEVVGSVADALDPVADGVVAPVASAAGDLIEALDPVLDTVVTPVADVADTLVGSLEPVVDPLLTPVMGLAGSVIELAEPVLEPIIVPSAEVIEDVLQSLEPALDPVTGLASSITSPLADAVSPIIEAVADVIEPVTPVVNDLTAPLEPLVDPLLSPVLEVVAPLTEPLLGPITSQLSILDGLSGGTSEGGDGSGGTQGINLSLVVDANISAGSPILVDTVAAVTDTLDLPSLPVVGGLDDLFSGGAYTEYNLALQADVGASSEGFGASVAASLDTLGSNLDIGALLSADTSEQTTSTGGGLSSILGGGCRFDWL